MEEDKMTVILLEPGKLARTAKIGRSLRELQQIVGGGIEAAYYFPETVCLVCNEEGKVCGLPLNRAVYGRRGELLDIIAGTAFICDCQGENFDSLSTEQLARYKKRFLYPKYFIRTAEGIMGVPYRLTAERER